MRSAKAPRLLNCPSRISPDARWSSIRGRSYSEHGLDPVGADKSIRGRDQGVLRHHCVHYI